MSSPLLGCLEALELGRVLCAMCHQSFRRRGSANKGAVAAQDDIVAQYILTAEAIIIDDILSNSSQDGGGGTNEVVWNQRHNGGNGVATAIDSNILNRFFSCTDSLEDVVFKKSLSTQQLILNKERLRCEHLSG